MFERHICVQCQRVYRPEKIGVYVLEVRKGFGADKLWSADLLVCPSCHHEMIDGFSEKPIAIRSDTDFLTEILKAVDSGIRLFDFYFDPNSLNSEPNPLTPADIHWQRVLEECPRPGSTIEEHRLGEWRHVVALTVFPNRFGPVCISNEVLKKAPGHFLTQSQAHAIRTDEMQSKRAGK